MVAAARLLGFAFANADLLIEIDRAGTIVFASGAASEFVADADPELVGRDAAQLFDPPAAAKFVTCARGLEQGGRAGPLRLKLANGVDVNVSLCVLPPNDGRISCTLSYPGQRQGFDVSPTDQATNLPTRDNFLAAASEIADGRNAMTLVDVPALPEACAALPPAEAERLMQHIGALVQAAGPKAAGRVSETTFGAVAEAGKPSKLADDIRTALKEGGLEHSNIAETLVTLAADGLSAEQRLLAVRYVVGRFAEGAHDGKSGDDLCALFDDMVNETQTRALELTDTVLRGSFALVYQPVYDLASGSLVHCEALARFENASSTGETVAFAEALGISDAFDVAVTAKVLSEAEANPDTRISLNLSGGTLTSAHTFGLVAGLLACKRILTPRIQIELTDTVEITDLAAAQQAIHALRSMGFTVGLDDFGAGASSFQYLHAFEVDFVKFDSPLIRKLGATRRDDMLLSGIVKLCKELGMTTVAEGIEDAELLTRARAIGFDLGQGHHLGKPTEKPCAVSDGKRKTA
jgi:EAL domain-containing protein (putative c-di-GMP-specific phosphodiesterase class I)